MAAALAVPESADSGTVMVGVARRPVGDLITMAEADSGAGPKWQWDVALSFAGAQRDYVEQVAQALRARGVRYFYDADEQIALWGKHLSEALQVIYGERAAAVVIFVSAEYAARDWTRAERRAAIGRAVRERREYVLPARFDDTPVPGLPPDTVWIDLRGRTPQQFAAMIADKLAAIGIPVPSPPTDAGSPAQDAGSAQPAGAVRAAEADLRQAQLLELKRIAEEIRASRERVDRIQRPAQAKRVDVSKYIGGIPRFPEPPPGRDDVRSRDQGGGRPGADFLTIRISNNSDGPVYDLAISWRRDLLSREPWGEPDRLGTLRPGRHVQRFRELPEPALYPLTEIHYGAVVYFRDANGIRWRVEPDRPPEEVRWKWPGGPWPNTTDLRLTGPQ